MPIYEYYSPDTNRIYSFFAKTLAQGKTVPKCPDKPGARMEKIVSGFAIGGRTKAESEAAPVGGPGAADDPRLDSAMAAMEKEMAGIDENDPRAMARMMRRMAELSGEKIDGPMEEAVRKLEEGADPEQLDEEFGDVFDDAPGAAGADEMPGAAGDPKSGTRRKTKVRRAAPVRDPKLYDYE